MLRIYMLPPRGLASLLVSESEQYARRESVDAAKGASADEDCPSVHRLDLQAEPEPGE